MEGRCSRFQNLTSESCEVLARYFPSNVHLTFSIGRPPWSPTTSSRRFGSILTALIFPSAHAVHTIFSLTLASELIGSLCSGKLSEVAAYWSQLYKYIVPLPVPTSSLLLSFIT